MSKGRTNGTKVAAVVLLLLVGCTGAADQQVAVPPDDPPANRQVAVPPPVFDPCPLLRRKDRGAAIQPRMPGELLPLSQGVRLRT